MDAHFILENFRAFYGEIARLKTVIKAGQYSRLIPGVDNILKDSDLAQAVSSYLKSILHEQYKHLAENGTQIEIESYKQAQYVMAALADEIFILELNWTGQEDWGNCLLEAGLFNTQSAGQSFFIKLDALLNDRTNASYEELAAVYLLAIRLGFSGQYRGEQGRVHLENYCQKLYRLIGNRENKATRSTLFTQAYRYVLSQAIGERLAPLRFWYIAIAGITVLYLIVTYAAWRLSIAPIYRFFS